MNLNVPPISETLKDKKTDKYYLRIDGIRQPEMPLITNKSKPIIDMKNRELIPWKKK